MIFVFLRTIVATIAFSLHLSADSFQDELLRNRGVVLQAIGHKRFKYIEDYASTREIYRITQLLEIPGIGEKIVAKLGAILGYRFGYFLTFDTCVKSKGC
jgi:hypothetical protein